MLTLMTIEKLEIKKTLTSPILKKKNIIKMIDKRG